MVSPCLLAVAKSKFAATSFLMKIKESGGFLADSGHHFGGFKPAALSGIGYLLVGGSVFVGRVTGNSGQAA
jgi:hypothetical protein